MDRLRNRLLAMTCILLGVAWSSPARAGRFLLVLETETLGPGEGEVVQAVSWTRTQDGPVRSSEFSWQFGLEVGVVKNLHVGLALPAYNVVTGDQGTETDFDGIATWGIWNFLPPEPGRIGLSAVGIVSESADDLRAECGVVLESTGGPLAVLANASYVHRDLRGPDEGGASFLLGRLGIGLPIGRGFALAAEGEVLAAHLGSLRYRGESFGVGPALLWQGGRAWFLAGALFDPDPDTTQRGASLQAQVGLPF